MAIGALFMSLTPGYTSGDLSSYMFGSIITVTSSDVMAMGILAAICVIGTLFWWRSIMYMAFDRNFAASQGIATRTASYALMIVVAIAIVMAIRIMGIVLLLSLFTIPAVTANSLTKSYASISFWAAIIATSSAVIGLVVSYHWEIPPGTSIIFTLTIVLFAVKLYIFAKQKLNLDA
jgi:zinc transport system permease protein